MALEEVGGSFPPTYLFFIFATFAHMTNKG